ncbi:S9 family peptidase [Kutzneria sp. CA-103260]|uniref:S9 family peptidase n=1 Tax=Kutzneria sp. CA-103260 TaxID=2802641 RepID=UPI001BA5A3AB|nr:prolyl oligopeptidase family serine peptidase [Kutzneria sp. CA-103260]
MLTAEMIVDSWIPMTTAVSPDGRWVAYTQRQVGRPVSEVWLAGGDHPPRRLAVGTDPRWDPDSLSLCYLVDGVELHRITLSGTDIVLVNWPAGIDSHLPLVDGVAFVAADSPAPEIEVRSVVRPSRLRLADSSGIRVLYGDRHVAEVAQQPGGGPLAVLTWSSHEVDPGLLSPSLHVVSLSGEVRDLGPAVVGAHSPVWRLVGDWRVAYLAHTPPSLQSGTAVYDVVDGNLTAGLPACPVELVQMADGDPLVVVASGLDTFVRRLSGPVVSRHTGLVEAVSAGGESVAAIVSTADDPPDVHFRGVRVTDLRPWTRDIEWGTQRRFSYQASDGLELEGLLILPPVGTGPFPLVTIVHGGPYDRFADQFGLHWVPSGQWLALAGYAVFLPNPRGSQGRGHEFATTVTGAVGQEEWTDILTGIDLLVADGVADAARLGIYGWSHGGFMAAWAIGHSNRFAAAIMGAGVTDWGMLVGSGEWGMFEASLGGSTGWEGVGPHRHDELSPISYAANVRTPVLIVHGAADTNVPVAQSEYFHRALRYYGVEHEFVVYPREGHSFREREHQVDLHHRVREWFGRWL